MRVLPAAWLDGSHVTSIGSGPYFCKEGGLMYWYNHDRVLRRRAVERE